MTKIKNVHFIGIGGVGMSGIALVACQRGFNVSGSDMKESSMTRNLRKAGVQIFIGHDAKNIADDVEAVVISTAIPEKNPELIEAKKHNIPILHRSQMLAKLGEGLKTLACAGTHGKTTTSSMLATTIDRMGLDPNFLIGGTVDGYDTNAKSGKGDFYIVEADESDGSFVHLSPYVALITNIEADHLDHYGNLDAIYDAFRDFISLIPEDGAAIVCADNPKISEIAKSTGKRWFSYGSEDTDAAQIKYKILHQEGLGFAFEVSFPDGKTVQSAITHNPGIHNILNATGVLGVCWAAGLDIEKAAQALSSFSGVRRRFDLVGKECGITIVDDYAHHPTEIKATLEAASMLNFKHVHVLFQPHRYTRTQALAPLFADAFNSVDSVTLMDVYPAGEAPIPGINGKTVVDSILDKNPHHICAWMPHRMETIPYLLQKLKEGDLLITMGAGDVTSMGPDLLDALKETHGA